MTTAVITATEILYGKTRAARLRQDPTLPVHPALALIEWEDDNPRAHSLAIGVDALGGLYWACDCGGWKLHLRGTTVLEASASAISHALTTCAVCHGPKAAHGIDGRMDVFPRCSNCAF